MALAKRVQPGLLLGLATEVGRAGVGAHSVPELYLFHRVMPLKRGQGFDCSTALMASVAALSATGIFQPNSVRSYTVAATTRSCRLGLAKGELPRDALAVGGSSAALSRPYSRFCRAPLAVTM